MQITASSGKKIYVRGSGGFYDYTRDSYVSQTITLPDDATPDQILTARFKLLEELDLAVDLHLFVNGTITQTQLLEHKAKRHASYSAVIDAFVAKVEKC